MNLYIIRHGQSEGNINPQAYYDMPDWKIPLTEEGKKQAEKVSDQLRNLYKPFIYSSPYIRAKETANIIAKPHGGFFYENGLIYERLWGNLRKEVDSFTTREERKHLFDFYRRPIGGESFADCYQRVFMFLEYLKNTYGCEDFYTKDIVIVSHGEFLKLLLMIIDGVTVEKFENMPKIKNCEIIQRHV